jgi:hypothetical protein
MVLDKGDFTVLVSHLSFLQNKNENKKKYEYLKESCKHLLKYINKTKTNGRITLISNNMIFSSNSSLKFLSMVVLPV